MKYFTAFMLLFITNCLEPSAMSATINAKNTTSCISTIYPKKEIDKRVEKGKKVKRVAACFLGLGFLISLISPVNSYAALPYAVAAITCFIISLILFLAGVPQRVADNIIEGLKLIKKAERGEVKLENAYDLLKELREEAVMTNPSVQL